MIDIDSDVFTFDEEQDMSKETFVVTGDFDPAVVVTALDRASDRFMAIDENGIEHDAAGLDAAFRAGLETPSYVSDPEVTSQGVQLYVDCNGVIPDPMAEGLRRVLREELSAVGVEARVRAVDQQ